MKLPLRFRQLRSFRAPRTPIQIADAAGLVVCTLPGDQGELAMKIIAMANRDGRQEWLETRNTGLEEYNAKAF